MVHVGDKDDFRPRDIGSPKNRGDSPTKEIAKSALQLVIPSSASAKPHQWTVISSSDTGTTSPSASTILSAESTSFSPTEEGQIKKQAAAIKTLDIGVITIDELERELRYVYREAAGLKEGTMKACYRSRIGADLPRSFFVEKKEGKILVTIAFNRQTVRQGLNIRGDGYPVPFQELGAFKTLKWGVRFTLAEPESIRPVIIASQRKSRESVTEAALLSDLSTSPEVARMHFSDEHISSKEGFVKQIMVFDYYVLGDLAHSNLSSEETREALHSAAKGVKYLHDNNIAHRDIKPSNVFRGPEKTVIGDLGTAIKLTPDLTPEQKMNFTPTRSYMAPEMAAARGSDEKEKALDLKAYDCWSFGVMALCLLTGSFAPPWCYERVLLPIDQILKRLSQGGKYPAWCLKEGKLLPEKDIIAKLGKPGHYPAWACKLEKSLIPDNRLLVRLSQLSQEEVTRAVKDCVKEPANQAFLLKVLHVNPAERAPIATIEAELDKIVSSA